MAKHLTSLAEHYDQMASALRDNEAGEVFSREDIQGQSQRMSRDFDFDVPRRDEP